MALDTPTYLTALQSFAGALGVYEDVQKHEPTSAPGPGIRAAVFFAGLKPLPAGSGLSATTGLVTFQMRQYLAMTYDPKDDIDVLMLAASDGFIAAVSGDFDLGGSVRNVDLLGAYSGGLTVDPGYLTQDSALFRVYTISIPLVVNDVWSQSA